jgi:hypothetical protein
MGLVNAGSMLLTTKRSRMPGNTYLRVTTVVLLQKMKA